LKSLTLNSIEISKFEVSEILSGVLLNLSKEQLNLSSSAARDKVCSMFLDELIKAEEPKNV